MTSPMPPETLAALKASIAKWERNAVAETPDEYHCYADTCPLCERFLSHFKLCGGCPVKQRTGWILCGDSPWENAEIAWDAWDSSGLDSDRDEALAAAREEVAFLRSLLPESDDA